MSTTRLRAPRHRCNLPAVQGGEIVRCDICGATWIGRCPPNPDFWRWHRLTWLERKIRGLP